MNENVTMNEETIVLAPKNKYQLLLEHLRNQLFAGNGLDETRAFSDNTNASKYGVSRVTASKVITGLVQEGLLYRIQGKGTFVNKEILSKKKKKGTFFFFFLIDI